MGDSKGAPRSGREGRPGAGWGPDPGRTDDMLRALERAGYRLTAARRAVVEVLQRGDHKSAPEVVAEVKRRHPRVGRASVYRTLTLLSRLGALQPSLLRTAQAHYAATRQGHHHHFICNGCREVIEVEECGTAELIDAIERRWGVRVEGHLVEFYGWCRLCQGGGGHHGPSG